MTAPETTFPLDSGTPPAPPARTRRAMLGGILGGLGVAAASFVGRPSAVRASDPNDVGLAVDNYASALTRILNQANNVDVLGASTDGSGTAVDGYSQFGIGVRGGSSESSGVYAISANTTVAASVGVSTFDSTGVQGFSGAATLPAAKAKTGVYGYAAQDANAVGVYGKTLTGRGVTGEASSGIGIRALATNGTGIYASATTGVGLRTTGRVLFDNCSGIATINSGTSSVTVTPGIDLLTSSAAVATLQGNPAGSALVKSCDLNTTTNTLTIRLNTNASATLKVAWHVFG